MLNGPPDGLSTRTSTNYQAVFGVSCPASHSVSKPSYAKSRFRAELAASQPPERSWGILGDSRANRAWCAIVGLGTIVWSCLVAPGSFGAVLKALLG